MPTQPLFTLGSVQPPFQLILLFPNFLTVVASNIGVSAPLNTSATYVSCSCHAYNFVLLQSLGSVSILQYTCVQVYCVVFKNLAPALTICGRYRHCIVANRKQFSLELLYPLKNNCAIASWMYPDLYLKCICCKILSIYKCCNATPVHDNTFKIYTRNSVDSITL